MGELWREQYGGASFSGPPLCFIHILKEDKRETSFFSLFFCAFFSPWGGPLFFDSHMGFSYTRSFGAGLKSQVRC